LLITFIILLVTTEGNLFYSADTYPGPVPIVRFRIYKTFGNIKKTNSTSSSIFSWTKIPLDKQIFQLIVVRWLGSGHWPLRGIYSPLGGVDFENICISKLYHCICCVYGYGVLNKHWHIYFAPLTFEESSLKKIQTYLSDKMHLKKVIPKNILNCDFRQKSWVFSN
jgi:hypothetical protein